VVGDEQFIVVDGQEGKRYDDIGASGLLFSPDGKRVAYAAQAGEDWLVVADGIEGKRYDGLLQGSRLVFDSPARLYYLAVMGNRIYLVQETIQ
jgi:hypothetical protein